MVHYDDTLCSISLHESYMHKREIVSDSPKDTEAYENAHSYDTQELLQVTLGALQQDRFLRIVNMILGQRICPQTLVEEYKIMDQSSEAIVHSSGMMDKIDMIISCIFTSLEM